ncbi:MAG: methionine--tRNA ligase [Actinomycetia bacterium]|nr:methionine--tRNA ligase [Actinomycetes bacterium]
MGRFYITTPIYYVNDVPHIGHAYTTAAADVAARFHRQLGDDVFFLTGTDEHGTKVEQAAAARGLTPKEHADEMVVKFKEVARKVGASNDFFIRTTDPQHERYVQDFVQRCYEAGDIYKSSYSGLYCPACEAYYTEENLAGGLCPDHGTVPVRMDEENYFFRLSAFQERLAGHYKSHPDFVRPRHRYNEALAFIEQGLDDISISRATLKWGISVPWDPSQVIYVWVDALINYLSALTYASDQDLFPRFWPASYHLMAQDILKFHGIIWPALLMSAGYDLPEHLFIHGYLKLGGEKISKTRGNVMDPFPLIERYGADPFRFYCLREVSFGQDGVVSEEGFKARYNSELANELGNLLSRTVSMVGKYRGGAVPAPPPGYADPPECAVAHPGSPLAVEATATCAAVRTQLEEMDLSAALESIWAFVRRLNRYVEEQAPWKLAKEEAAERAGGGSGAPSSTDATAGPGAAGGDSAAASAGTAYGSAAATDRGPAAAAPATVPAAAPATAALDATLWDLAEGLRLLSVLLHPFMPETSAAIRERLGLAPAAPAAVPAAGDVPGPGAGAAGPSWSEAVWGLLPAGCVVGVGPALFPRIEE